jgi:hypothetical protein
VAGSEATREAYDAVTAEMRGLGAESGVMMGMPCLKIGGKLFAGYDKAGAMTFKLDGEPHATALALEGSHIFDPSGRRPMKQWVAVPHAHAKRWPDLARTALDHVRANSKG